MNAEHVRGLLDRSGQSQVLRFWGELDETRREKLSSQVGALQLDRLPDLVRTYVTEKPPVPLPKRIEPVKVYPRVPGADQQQLYRDAQKRGEELLREGKVGAFLVAGGQGTRLGYDGPKGEYPVTPIKNKPLFQVFAEQLLAYSRDFGKAIAWYVMT
ncbi:MAG TPA: UTP--glucose-1-phosphate uridylyltransferase, partial [Tepidisphaeraceae bacterium]